LYGNLEEQSASVSQFLEEIGKFIFAFVLPSFCPWIETVICSCRFAGSLNLSSASIEVITSIEVMLHWASINLASKEKNSLYKLI